AKHVPPVIKFSHDGTRLLTTEFLKGQWTARVWDVDDAKCVSDLQGHGAVLGAEFLSDEELLTWDMDGKFCRWSLATGDVLEVISPAWRGAVGHEERTKSAEFSNAS